jgi:hypothetical protein
MAIEEDVAGAVTAAWPSHDHAEAWFQLVVRAARSEGESKRNWDDFLVVLREGAETAGMVDEYQYFHSYMAGRADGDYLLQRMVAYGDQLPAIYNELYAAAASHSACAEDGPSEETDAPVPDVPESGVPVAEVPPAGVSETVQPTPIVAPPVVEDAENDPSYVWSAIPPDDFPLLFRATDYSLYKEFVKIEVGFDLDELIAEITEVLAAAEGSEKDTTND